MGGGLVLVLVRVNKSNGASCNPNGIASHEDKHKAPSSTLPHPLSLQDVGAASVSLQFLIVKIHLNVTSLRTDGDDTQ